MISKNLYKWARLSRDINAIMRALKKRSFKPILKRIWNKLLGRTIISKLWWR